MPERFIKALDELKKQLLTMGALAEGMLQKVTAALVDRRAELIREVREDEKEMNSFQRRIDNEVVRLIGVFTPVAGDLRFLLMATRINAELERVGDQAENICNYFEDLLREEPLHTSADLAQIAALAQQMLHRALDAFVEKSPPKAVEVMKMDDQVDDLKDRMFRELLDHMHREPQMINRALGLILTARSFERVADLAVDIAEDVVYIVEGKDVRHVKVSW